jgi:3-oxoacyl-[acyl-carrier protein] reductase
MTLNGEIALVTGGSRGIGKAICLALAQQGAEAFGKTTFPISKRPKRPAMKSSRQAAKHSEARYPDVSDTAATQTAVETLVKVTGQDFDSRQQRRHYP